ncbi:MAG: translation elongation factor Ts [[Eubacterium] siraeum]
MAISAQAVKQLKELTNCGMMDCKRALEETNGDVDAAIKNLREKGLAKAAKKSGRIAAEGLVYTKIDEAKKVGVVVEINVETDFAAKTDRFIEFVELVANTIIDNDVADVDALKEVVPAGQTEKIADILTERIATIGENIQIRRFKRMTGNLFAYTHNGGGSIIGSMIKIEADDVDSDAVKACARIFFSRLQQALLSLLHRLTFPLLLSKLKRKYSSSSFRTKMSSLLSPSPRTFLRRSLTAE